MCIELIVVCRASNTNDNNYDIMTDVHRSAKWVGDKHGNILTDATGLKLLI